MGSVESPWPMTCATWAMALGLKKIEACKKKLYSSEIVNKGVQKVKYFFKL
jgi:hypothetical protein